MAATARPTVLRVVEREMRVYRRLWRGSAFTNFLMPLMYLGAIGLGLGGIVDQRSTSVAGLSYLQFVTPGLLAASVMLLNATNGLWPVMAGTKWVRFFHGVVATPLSAADVFGGWVIWSGMRAGMAAAPFLVVAALVGGVPSWWAVLALPAAVLTGLAFASPLTAFAATQSTDLSFPIIIRLVIMPMFLFSGTFFPITQLPGWVQPLSRVSPLWHGAELCRAATTGQMSKGGGPGGIVIHVVVLSAIVAAGWMWGRVSFARKLTP